MKMFSKVHKVLKLCEVEAEAQREDAGLGCRGADVGWVSAPFFSQCMTLSELRHLSEPPTAPVLNRTLHIKRRVHRWPLLRVLRMGVAYIF